MAKRSNIWPGATERRLLGRFYLAGFASEATNFILPFQFVFLFLVMERPEWAVLPLLVESLVIFLTEIPLGAVADRFGRKRSVVSGDLLSALAWAAIPLAVFAEGPTQLVLVCACFALEGIAQTLVSGAEEAWVVDLLAAREKDELVDRYFAREKSFGSLGGLVSLALVIVVLQTVPMTVGMIQMLWFVSAGGQALAAWIQLGIPEERPLHDEEDGEEGAGLGFWRRTAAAFGAVRRVPALFAFLGVTLVVAFATSVSGDAFDIALVTRGLGATGFAAVHVVETLLGVMTPLVAVVLARRFGRRRTLIVLLVAPAVVASVLLLGPGLGWILALYVVFQVIDDLWDPVAETQLQSLIPSRWRATVTSIGNQGSELLGLMGLSLFAAMLGANAEALQEVTPDLLEVFGPAKLPEVPDQPSGFLGLPAPDLALFLFALTGLPAVILLRSRWWGGARGLEDHRLDEVEERAASDTDRTVVSTEPSPTRERLLEVKASIDRRLDELNPGEQLSWWVAEDAFELPDRTMEQLRGAGRALPEMFRVANEIFQEEAWVRERLEKRFTPIYRLLNQAQPDALPHLIRPDVVCDADWTPKLVELEITVGCRADTSIMAQQYGLDPARSLVREYARMIRAGSWPAGALALVTAPHPFFLDLPDDARAFGELLRREGLDVIVLTGENLGRLFFDGQSLKLLGDDGQPAKTIGIFDRFIDIYEIAELQHAGLGALLDAYLAGAVRDVNTCKQFFDEKDWMSLFWEPRLAGRWQSGLSEESHEILRRLIPGTWIVREDTVVRTKAGLEVPLLEVADLRAEHRQFVVKESGTSTTASGAQSFRVLPQMDRDGVYDLLRDILRSGSEHVIQELVESPKIEFTALDPEDDRVVTQRGARFKLSVFYVDGRMSDLRFVASNVKYAVNDQDCVVGVVR